LDFILFAQPWPINHRHGIEAGLVGAPRTMKANPTTRLYVPIIFGAYIVTAVLPAT
jgi:hypothetical protein